MLLQVVVALAGLFMIARHFKTRGVDEANVVRGTLCLGQLLSLAIIFGQRDELKSSLEVAHVEVSYGDAGQPIDPPRVQVDSLTKPEKGTPVHLELAVADGKTVDQGLVGRVLAQSLSIVVHRGLNLTLLGAYHAFLLPELGAFHVFDVSMKV